MRSGERSNTASVVECVRWYAADAQHIETPCAQRLREAGAEGIAALAALIEEERNSGEETDSCYAVELLAAFKHPAVGPALIEVLKRPGTAYPDEVRECVFNCGVGNDALLTPLFLDVCRDLRANWRTETYRIDLIDQFLAWADRKTEAR